MSDYALAALSPADRLEKRMTERVPAQESPAAKEGRTESSSVAAGWHGGPFEEQAEMENNFVTRDELKQFGRDIQSGSTSVIAAAVQAAQAAQTAAITKAAEAATASATNDAISNLEKKWANERREVQDKLSEHDTRLACAERTAQDQAKQIEKLQADFRKVLRDVETVSSDLPPLYVPDPSYDREVDATILRVRARAAVQKGGLQASLAELSGHAALDVKFWTLDGPALGQNFVLRFSGTPELAARRAGRLRDALKTPSGTWRRLVARPAVEGGEEVEYSVDEDKSKKTIALEKATRKLKNEAKALDPDTDYFARKRDHTLFAPGWVPIAKVESPAPGELNVRINSASALARALQDKGIERNFYKATSDPATAASWL